MIKGKCATVIDIYFIPKTQTLRLATSYIDYLMTLLNSDPNNAEFIDDFKVDIHKKWNEKTEEQKRRELVSFLMHILRYKMNCTMRFGNSFQGSTDVTCCQGKQGEP